MSFATLTTFSWSAYLFASSFWIAFYSVLCLWSRNSNAFNHEFEFLNEKKMDFFLTTTWRTAQAVQVLCANFPKPLGWCFPSILDRQTKLYTYSAIFSFSSPLGVLEQRSFGIYRFNADNFLLMHCVPCVLCPRLRGLRVNSILTWLTWKHWFVPWFVSSVAWRDCSVAA